MKKLLVVLAILFIGILLAGCTSQPAAPVATPAPTAVPTAVVTTAAPTVVPTTPVVVVVVNQTPTTTPTPTPTQQPTFVISFNSDMSITPGTTIYVPAGSKVQWKNNDKFKPHGIQASNMATGKYISTMSAVTIPYGTSLDITFPDPGTYDYVTIFQPSTYGKIIVTK
jgi:plastocyanin